MTTLVVVKKNGQVAIAADTLVTFGDTRLSSRFEPNSKIFMVDAPTGGSYIGMAGTVAHFPVLRKALAALAPEHLRLGSKDDVFDTFTRLHPVLKESFFLQTKEDDNDPYESSQFSVVIANANGIYGLYSYREIFSSRNFGASALAAVLRWAPCTTAGAKPKQRAKSLWPVFTPASNLTKTPPDRWSCSPSS